MDAEQPAARVRPDGSLNASLPIRPGEALVVVEQLHLAEADLRRLGEGHPEDRVAALVAWARARGGLPESGGTVRGTVASVSGPRADGVVRGSAVEAALARTPLILADISGWDGESREVPVSDGYAIHLP